MASTQVTLAGGTVSIIPLDAPTTRIVVTIESGTAAEVYATADGSLPVIPTSGVEVTGQQKAISAATGFQRVLTPPLFGDHMAIPTVRLLSAGTPTVTVEW